MAKLNPLGHASPDRYSRGSWPRVLLERMAYWVGRMNSDKHRMLDIGCGEGALLHELGFTGIGVDINSERLMLARERELSVILADGANLPFNDSKFSTIVSMEVLEHIPDMEPVIREVYRVLETDGVWVVSVPSVTLRSWYEMKREQRPYYCDADEHYREFSDVDIPWFEHRFMRMHKFVASLASAGFEIEHSDGVRYLFPQWLSRIPPLQRLFESPCADRIWAKLPWIKRFPYWTILVLRKCRAAT